MCCQLTNVYCRLSELTWRWRAVPEAGQRAPTFAAALSAARPGRLSQS
jgi:hypothetical protein